MVLKRLVLMLPTLLAVSILVFLVIHLVPGNPAEIMLGQAATPESIAALQQQLGLDLPLHVQYWNWLSSALRGDFGVDFRSNEPLSQILIRRLPVTAELALLSTVISVAVSLPLGILAAVNRRGVGNKVSSVLALLGISIPRFWMGIMLIMLFSLHFGWLPSSGYVPLTEDLWGNIRHMILPSMSLAIGSSAILTRIVRASMLEVLTENYINVAHAKGLTKQLIVLRHALPNASIPIVTIIGMQMGYLLGGAVVIEEVFALPGIGRLTIGGVFSRNYPVVQGSVLLLAFIFLVVNLITDIAYMYLNPQIRFDKK